MPDRSGRWIETDKGYRRLHPDELAKGLGVPKTWISEPTRGGPFDGSLIDQGKFEKMLEDYYTKRGWNTDTGIPTRETLEKLDLHSVADDLHKMGKL